MLIGFAAGPSQEDLLHVQQALKEKGGPAIPQNFKQTAEPFSPTSGRKRGNMPRVDLQNPQTLAIMELLGLRYGCPGCLQLHKVQLQAWNAGTVHSADVRSLDTSSAVCWLLCAGRRSRRMFIITRIMPHVSITHYTDYLNVYCWTCRDLCSYNLDSRTDDSQRAAMFATQQQGEGEEP